jgi:hypothetical protein
VFLLCGPAGWILNSHQYFTQIYLRFIFYYGFVLCIGSIYSIIAPLAVGQLKRFFAKQSVSDH